MRVLITGGCGYIGSELVKELLLDRTIEEISSCDNFSRANYSFF